MIREPGCETKTTRSEVIIAEFEFIFTETAQLIKIVGLRIKFE